MGLVSVGEYWDSINLKCRVITNDVSDYIKVLVRK
jgi:hypothetical protein